MILMHGFDAWQSWQNDQRRVFRTNLVTFGVIFVKSIEVTPQNAYVSLEFCRSISKLTRFVVTITPRVVSSRSYPGSHKHARSDHHMCMPIDPVPDPERMRISYDTMSPFYGQPYLFCLGDVAAPHSIKFSQHHIIPGLASF